MAIRPMKTAPRTEVVNGLPLNQAMTTTDNSGTARMSAASDLVGRHFSASDAASAAK